MAWNDPGQWSWLNFRPAAEVMLDSARTRSANASILQREVESRRQDFRQREAMAIRQSDIDEQRAYHDSLIRLQQEKANRLQTGVQSFQNALVASGPATQDPVELKNRALNWTIQNPWMMADDDVAQALRPAISAISELARQKEELEQQKAKADAASIHGVNVKRSIEDLASIPREWYPQFLQANGGDATNMTPAGMDWVSKAKLAWEEQTKQQQAQRALEERKLKARDEWMREDAELKWLKEQGKPKDAKTGAEIVDMSGQWEKMIQEREAKVRGLAQEAEVATEYDSSGGPEGSSASPVLKITKDPQTGRAVWNR